MVRESGLRCSVMSPLPLLLRVALCIALILNGSGVAVAATQMHVQHAAVAAEMGADQGDHATCGEHGTEQTLSSAESLSTECESSATDCCDSSTCNAACPAGFLATLTAMAPVWHPTPDSPSSRPVIPNAPAPLLHSHYRPPIR